MSEYIVRPARSTDIIGIRALLQPMVEQRILLGKDLAVLYGERAAEFMKAHGTEIGLGLALAAVLIGTAVFLLRRRRHGSAAA